AAEIGGGAVAVRCDVSNDKEVATLFKRVETQFGRLDALINVAGTHGRRPVGVLTVDEFDKMTAVNLRGVLLMAQHAVPQMIANVSAIAAVNVERRTSFMYAAAKAGVNALTKSLAVEYGPRGVRANAIAPGFTFTEFMGEETPVSREMSAKSALGRAGAPQEL